MGCDVNDSIVASPQVSLVSCFPVVPVSPNVSMWGLQLNVVCLFQEQLQLKNVEKQLLHLQRKLGVKAKIRSYVV